MEAATLIGIVGATASVVSFTPQAWKIIRERRTKGLSLPMYLLTCLSFASWLTFGILRGEWALIFPNAICLAFSLFIAVMIALPGQKTAEVARKLDPKG